MRSCNSCGEMLPPYDENGDCPWCAMAGEMDLMASLLTGPKKGRAVFQASPRVSVECPAELADSCRRFVAAFEASGDKA